ncbi:MAG: hypothetical protein LBB53_03615 [Prevotellaceae bacterium]|jgi:hypothetical protein|nr:hypothetical protein [Prevotellaceae bacterium]
MINIFKKARYRYFLREKKHFTDNNSGKIFLNYSKINSILLIFKIVNDSDLITFENLKNIISKDKKSVVLCCYSEQKKSILEPQSDLIVIKKEKLNFWQKPSKEIISKISALKFDAVFFLSQNVDIPLLYALLYSNAKIKCGAQMPSGLLDFMIDATNSSDACEKFILDNILFYLKKINQ